MATPQPSVSIITPTYNQAGFISRCIESVRSQTYGEWEQIVVDDGSTDGTPDLVDGFGDPRIRCLRLPHRGLASLAESYNAALDAARGDLVAIVEGDDAWPADKLEKQVPVFSDPDVFLSWGRAIRVDEAGRATGEISSLTTRKDRIDLTSDELFRRLTQGNVLAPSLTVMIRRTALDRIGGFHQSGSTLFVDLPTWLRLAADQRGTACFVNEPLGYYRVHAGQTSQIFRYQMAGEHYRSVVEVLDRLEEADLRRIGWNSVLRRHAELSGILADGLKALHAGDMRGSRVEFARAIRQSRRPGDLGKAMIGFFSASVGRDLLSPCYDLRLRSGSWLRALLRPD